MSGVPDEDRRDHRERQRRRDIGRRIAQPAPALGVRTTKTASPATLSAALYFDSPATPSPAPAASQRRQIARRPDGLTKNNRASAQAAGGKAEQEGPVGHDPGPGGGEEERADVEGERPR